MLYDRQLPLYVTALYPTFLYTGIMIARRLGLSRIAEGCAAGLIIVAIDMPYDIMGPVLGWWYWSDTEPNIAARWQGVPVTSYCWHLTFGAVMAGPAGVIAPRVRAASRLWLAVPLAAATVVVAMIVAFV